MCTPEVPNTMQEDLQGARWSEGMANCGLPHRPEHRRSLQRQRSGRWNSTREVRSLDPPTMPSRERVEREGPSRWSSTPDLGSDMGLPIHPTRRESINRRPSMADLSVCSISYTSTNISNDSVGTSLLVESQRISYQPSRRRSSLFSITSHEDMTNETPMDAIMAMKIVAKNSETKHLVSDDELSSLGGSMLSDPPSESTFAVPNLGKSPPSIRRAGSGCSLMRQGSGRNLMRQGSGRNLVRRGSGRNLIRQDSGQNLVRQVSGRNLMRQGSRRNLLGRARSDNSGRNLLLSKQSSARNLMRLKVEGRKAPGRSKSEDEIACFKDRRAMMAENQSSSPLVNGILLASRRNLVAAKSNSRRHLFPKSGSIRCLPARSKSNHSVESDPRRQSLPITSISDNEAGRLRLTNVNDSETKGGSDGCLSTLKSGRTNGGSDFGDIPSVVDQRPHNLNHLMHSVSDISDSDALHIGSFIAKTA